jgi:cellulose synthase/poly-beta-1,6-N-acetylglucosamine synthase-like glycosyltransferase
VALTCEKLVIELQAIGIENLRHKESDRIEAVQKHEVRNDHRMAMALMCADFPVSIEEQTCIAKSYPNFVPQHITPIKGVNDDNLGKKHALSKLIHAATSEYVWLHDDDVVLPEATQKAVLLEGDLIILPLKMESLSDKPSLLERLQIAEYAAIQELTMRSAKKDQAVMCSGANLIVKREVWLECEKDLHFEIPSGDDMFLLEAVKRCGYKISVIDEPDYTAVVRPQTTWRAFFRQRMRWAGKAPKYTDRDIIRCGRLVIAANIVQILCPLIILIKFPIEWSLIKAREPQAKWYVALLLEILYPFYLLICLIGGLFRRSW